MTIHYSPFFKFSVLASAVLVGCTATRQLAVDYPSAGDAANSGQSTKTRPFQALPSFQAIDGDDYYVRLVKEFDFKGSNALSSDCSSLASSFGKNDLSSALIFNVHNSILKFNAEAVGYSYQSITGQCNFKFDAKKQNLTPWMRLDTGKETQVDYSIYSSANNDVDVNGLVNKATAASSLLAFTGVGMGVAVLGQFAGHWLANNPQNATAPAPSANHSAEIHSLPTWVSYTDKNGSLNETVFKVNVIAEGGVSILGEKAKPLGELRVYPEITSSLLLKTQANGLPDARDISLLEINQSPMKSATGDTQFQQLLEQSKHPEKPNLQPDWNNYEDVQNNCRKIKVVMKDLGFNKFDRNAYLYHFLLNSIDWKNYNIPAQKAQADEIPLKSLQSYRSKNFGSCLISDDFIAMKAMGLPVNTESDWALMGDSSQKQAQFFMPLKSIERQLLTVLKAANPTEMESQIYPLLDTSAKGEGTVLLQDRLGDFGLEKLLQPAPAPIAAPAPNPNPNPNPNPDNVAINAATATPSPSAPPPIPGEGLVVTAHQLVQAFWGLAFNEFSCARVVPGQIGKQPAASLGILLFTTKPGSPRAKGGALEFEFSDGKINRIAFQSPSYRDFEQSVIDHPGLGDCRIDPALLTNLH